MTDHFDEPTKKTILKRISTPGISIEDIAQEMNIEQEELLEFLGDEFFKHNLEFGRRMCCRF